MRADPLSTAWRASAIGLCLCLAGPAEGAALRLQRNAPQQFDFVDLARLPPAFGRGEFSFEIWLQPDANWPVGPTWRGTHGQLNHWSDADPEPAATPTWWHAGNFLLDGHTRPRGFGAADTREGTFSLQFYGGGRLRWLFADGDLALPGKVWPVQAWPADTTRSLLDGNWHHVVALRRWREPQGATLELWIDGRRIAARDIPDRVDMRRWWDALAHPDDPAELGGWSLGAEIMTAWDVFFTQYEDYKGLVDELRLWSRALSPGEIAAAAAGTAIPDDRLLAHVGFDEGRGDRIADRLDPDHPLILHRGNANSWANVDAPAAPSLPTSESPR